MFREKNERFHGFHGLAIDPENFFQDIASDKKHRKKIRLLRNDYHVWRQKKEVRVKIYFVVKVFYIIIALSQDC